jgi:hypothetical protein
MKDECPKCQAAMKRSEARMHKGLMRRRCTKCGESDYAWFTLRQLGARLTDATAGQLKSAILSLQLQPTAYRGDGEAREYGPDAQLALIAALRRSAIESSGRRSRRST